MNVALHNINAWVLTALAEKDKEIRQAEQVLAIKQAERLVLYGLAGKVDLEKADEAKRAARNEINSAGLKVS